MAYLAPGQIRKRKSDTDLERVSRRGDMDQNLKLRDLYPLCEPDIADKLNALQVTIDKGIEELEGEPREWEMKLVLDSLFNSIQKPAYELSQIQRRRKDITVDKTFEKIAKESSDYGHSEDAMINNSKLRSPNFERIFQKISVVNNVIGKGLKDVNIREIIEALKELKSCIGDSYSAPISGWYTALWLT